MSLCRHREWCETELSKSIATGFGEWELRQDVQYVAPLLEKHEALLSRQLKVVTLCDVDADGDQQL